MSRVALSGGRIVYLLCHLALSIKRPARPCLLREDSIQLQSGGFLLGYRRRSTTSSGGCYITQPLQIHVFSRFIQRPQLQLEAHQSRRPGGGLWYIRRTGLLAGEKQVNQIFVEKSHTRIRPLSRINSWIFQWGNLECGCYTPIVCLCFQLGNNLGWKRLHPNCQKQKQSLRDCQFRSLPNLVKRTESAVLFGKCFVFEKVGYAQIIFSFLHSVQLSGYRFIVDASVCLFFSLLFIVMRHKCKAPISFCKCKHMGSSINKCHS